MLQVLLDHARGLLAQGGPVMPYILGLSVVMWVLIIERYWYFWVLHPRAFRRVREQWNARAEYRSRTARRLRAQRVAALIFAGRCYLPLLRTFIQVLPLLGLLGTVSGLIHTFEIITLFGSNNRRGIAAGISEALIATLTGLVTALSGLYFSVNLESRATLAREQAETLQRE